MLQLNEAQIDRIISMDVAIEAMRDLLHRTRRNQIEVLPRRRLEDGDMYLATMASVDRASHLFSAKLYTTGARRGSFKLFLWNSRTGALLGMFDANRLGQLRTGAMSAVATDIMARKDAATLLLVGTGFQAETQALALSRVRRIEQIWVYSRNAANREHFVHRIQSHLPQAIAINSVDNVEPYARQADLIVTATTARTPVIHGAWLKPGVHLNAVGSNHPEHAEVDSETFARASAIATDHIEGARIESGDLLLGLAEEQWSRVTPLALQPSRTDPNAISIFVSQGIESEDLVLAEYVLRRWVEEKGGPEYES
ncbi:ornithine cyclodeaminase family protein [Sulfobacillus harzensis]|uniref:Ornithine cyclodeaminase family protein n=1 Tax=Sulfobacillus harzensis TaxID=2729629 RepID=A0A7Y0L2W7_9FIRM|nr:ornithine cyclodeaminase family protein [Sulfobacillus harzensis]NMP21405.1 ornithine cyclodeaminase family protein [Sulfobacillus harzensis]